MEYEVGVLDDLPLIRVSVRLLFDCVERPQARMTRTELRSQGCALENVLTLTVPQVALTDVCSHAAELTT